MFLKIFFYSHLRCIRSDPTDTYEDSRRFIFHTFGERKGKTYDNILYSEIVDTLYLTKEQ